jgi:hypothetical protein
MAIIGFNEQQQPYEIAAYCDDINWLFEDASLCSTRFRLPSLRTDMFYPSGIIHFWQNEYVFEVGISISSTNVKALKINK